MPLNDNRHARSALVSATELACFAYCPEQWRLDHGLRLLPSNQASRRQGMRHHSVKAVVERIASTVILVGRILAVVALLSVIYWLIFPR